MGRKRSKMRAHLNKMRIIKRKKLQERRLQRELEERELNNLDQHTDYDEDIKLEPEPPSSSSSESGEGMEEEAPGIKVEAFSSFPVNQNEGDDSITRDNRGDAKTTGDDPGHASTATASSAPTNKSKQSGTLPHNIQSLSVCFVCVKPLTSQETTRKVTEAEYICLLSDMLELSVSQSHEYLQGIGEPGKWIGLCHPCLGLIKEVGRRKIAIAKLEKEIRSRQQQIVKKMKGTKLNLRVRGKNGEEGNNASNEGVRALRTVRKILNFIHRRQYSPLFAEDHVANLIKNKDKTQHASFYKKTGSIDHRVVINRKQLRHRDNREEGEEEDPIFLNDDQWVKEEAVAVTDPLALDDDDADCIVNKPCSVFQSRVYYCGLCSDDQVYRSEEQLQLHTNQLHPPGSPSLKQAKRRKKQSFSAGSAEEELEAIEEQPARKRKSNPDEKEEMKPIVDNLDDNDLNSDLEEDEEAGENQEKGKYKKAKPVRFQYDCPNCPDVKNYSLCRFAQHLAIHQRRPYRCSICSALFPSDEVQMEAHWKKKHSDVEVEVTSSPSEKFAKMTLDPGPIWKCQGCPSGFRKENDRDVHELDCSPAFWNAYISKKKITQTGSKLVVLDPDDDLIHSCQICDKPFQNHEEWRLHRVLHHPDVDRLSCLLCELSFAEKTGDGAEARHDFKMLSHIKQCHKNGQARNHRILEECEECGLVFNSLLERQDHFLEAHGISKADNIVSCPVFCGIWLANLSLMRRHVSRVHLSGDAAVCDACGSSFNYFRTMVEHKLRKHGVLEDDYNSPVYTCPVEGCGYRTVKPEGLPIHSQMAHGEARKYICKTCGKGFPTSGKLNAHEKIHENKETKPYQCELCGNSFAVRNYLYIHMRLSHERRAFPSTNKKKQAPKSSSSRAHGESKKDAVKESIIPGGQNNNADGGQEGQLSKKGQSQEQHPAAAPQDIPSQPD